MKPPCKCSVLWYDATVKPPKYMDTSGKEPGVHITGVSVAVQCPEHRHQRDRAKWPHYRQRCLYYSQTTLIQTPKGQNQVSTLQKCLYCSQTSIIQTPKGQSQVATLQTEVSVLQSNHFNTDTKGTEASVHITKVFVLQSNLHNTDTRGTEPSGHITDRGVCITVKSLQYGHQRDRTKCPHYKGVCKAVKPP